ncbi:MAG: acetate--CoA ligase family protein [Armatimonadota bacterium]|nr:acetate--CoA ligase family protein [Armatimonadota bacterium]
MPDSLDRFFAPRAIAIIGASDDATKIGGRPLRYLRQWGFPGVIYPVNPYRDVVQGLPCFRSVQAIPGTFDHAVIAVPAEAVLDTLEACARKGATGATIFSSGFAEIGEDGRRLQQQLHDLVERLGLTVLGPNCQGFVNVAARAYPTFSSGIERVGVAPGPLAVISQSGVLSAVVYVQARQAGIGVSYWINTGNEVGIDAAAALRFVVRQPEVTTVALALETIRDGDTYAAAMGDARRLGKLVFAVKGGRTSAGAEASLSHTAALLSRDDAYAALFEQTGTARVGTLQELIDAAVLASWLDRRASGPAYRIAGRRLGVLTNSGGASILAADAAISRGLTVPRPSSALAVKLQAVLPRYAVAQNPLDLTGHYITHPELLDHVASAFAASGEVDALLVYLGIIGSLYPLDKIVESFEHLARQRLIPTVVVWQAGDESARRRIAVTGLPMFDDIDRAVAAIAATAWAGRPHRYAVPPGESTPARTIRMRIAAARRRGARLLDPDDARAVLDAYGIATVPGHLCTTPQDTAAATRATGVPVVLKVESPNLAHKTEAGGVRVGVTSPEAAAQAHVEMIEAVSRHHPDIRILGIRLEPMVQGLEMILGLFVDSALGPMITIGMGGLFVEVLGDVTTRRLPLVAGDIEEALTRLRGASLLDGYRGDPPADRPALINTIERWATLAWDLRQDLQEAEINPLVVGPVGKGAVAVDVMMVVRS